MRCGSPLDKSAQAEAVFVALMGRLKVAPINAAQVVSAVRVAKSNAQFDQATGRATADEDRVATRLRIASEAFVVA